MGSGPSAAAGAARGTLPSERYFEEVISAARASLRPGITHDVGLCGRPLRISFADEDMESALFPALAHLPSLSGSTAGFHVISWSSEGSSRLVLGDAPHPMREAWDSGEVVSFRGERGYVAFDPRSRMVSVFDRVEHVVSCWTPPGDGPSFAVRAAPFTVAMNWWLAEEGVCVCHAAAVGSTEGVILLPGPGGSGKSTTAVGALLAGLDFLGDDYVAVDGSPDPGVWCLHGTVKLDPALLGGEIPVRADRVWRTTGEDWDKALLYVEDLQAGSVLGRGTASAIVIPRITDRVEPALSPTDAASAFKALAPSTVLQLPGNRRIKYEMLARLTRRLPAYELLLSPDRGRNTALITAFLDGGHHG